MTNEKILTKNMYVEKHDGYIEIQKRSTLDKKRISVILLTDEEIKSLTDFLKEAQ